MNRTIMICLSVLLLVFGTDRLHAGGQQSRRRAKRGAGCCEQCGTKCTAGKHGTARAGND